MRRRSLRPSVRFEILKRDGFACRYCGRRARDAVVLVVDHVCPVAHGGQNDEANLATACVECNAGKGARPLMDTAATDKEKRVGWALEEIQDLLEVFAGGDVSNLGVAELALQRLRAHVEAAAALTSAPSAASVLEMWAEVQEACDYLSRARSNLNLIEMALEGGDPSDPVTFEMFVREPSA